MAVAPTTMAEVDLTDLDLFADGFPHHLFELHRREAPVWWHEPTEHTPDGEGFWSVATHALVQQVQHDAVTYSSERGGDRPHGGTLLQDIEQAGMVLSMMDDPRHARIRRLVTSGMTPRTIRRLEEDLRRRTRLLLDAVEPGEPIDFLVEVAAELPMQAICGLLGVPEEDRHTLAEAVSFTFDIREGDAQEATSGRRDDLLAYAAALIAEKRERPTDDMLSTVVHATLDDVDPPQLTDLELWSFFILLFSAGANTTRDAIAGGLLALIDHPDQLADLRADPDGLLPTAIEEVLRWTSPSPAKRRTATVTTELGGHTIEPGDKVLFWEGSANRDEAVFDEPHRFDIRRNPNPHLALGHGIHYCLGANLARLEMRLMFGELLERFERFELVQPVEWARSNRHTGIRHLVLSMA
ncbi:MAG TPA: cytochrome P450 [Acidimicrobiales bacterium]|nr:cytochrome P450 [Acidimicrobiales bacterium]